MRFHLTIGSRLILRSVMAVLGHRIEGVSGLERIKALGIRRQPFVLAIRHPGYRDTLLVACLLMRAMGMRPISFMIDWMFMHAPLLGILVSDTKPIAVWRKRSRWAWLEARRPACQPDPITEAAGRLRAGLVVGVFPEGSRGLHATNLQRMRLGVARLALETGCPVVPVGLSYRGQPGGPPAAAARAVRRVTVRIGAPVRPEGRDIRRLSIAIGQEIARLSDLPPRTPETARSCIRIPDHAVGMEARLIVEGAYDPATDQGGDPCSHKVTESA